MATPAQTAANRRNSQKSTGPRTAAGKAASSKNALKHGLFSAAIVIPDDENAADFEALQQDYFETCRPEGRLEIALVLELVRCDWLTRRTTAVETQLWAYTLAGRREWRGDNFDEDAPLAQGYNGVHKDLVLIQRRLTALSRSWHRAHAELQKLQSARAAAAAEGVSANVPSAPSATPPALHHCTPEPSIGTCPSPRLSASAVNPSPFPTPQIGFVPPNAAPPDPPDTGAPHGTLEVALP